MTTTNLYNEEGRLMGWIIIREAEWTLYSKDGATLGFFRPATNVTYEKNGSLVGYGNLLAVLLKK